MARKRLIDDEEVRESLRSAAISAGVLGAGHFLVGGKGRVGLLNQKRTLRAVLKARRGIAKTLRPNKFAKKAAEKARTKRVSRMLSRVRGARMERARRAQVKQYLKGNS